MRNLCMGLSVPEDLSVIGFDDVRECETFVPALTTIKQDHGQRAALAVKMLYQLKNGGVDKNVRLPVTLITRDSVRSVNMHKK